MMEDDAKDNTATQTTGHDTDDNNNTAADINAATKMTR